MRCLLLLPLALFVVACSPSGRSAIDRGGHAYVINPQSDAASGTVSPAGSPRAQAASGSEEVYIVQSGDRLYRIAGERGVSLRWLIQRNDLIAAPNAGDSLIVPGQARN